MAENEGQWDKAEKKKKKKSKKKEGEAAAPEPEPESVPPLEDEEWPPRISDETELQPAQDEEVPMENGPAETAVDYMDDLPPQQIEKRKSSYPIYWNRPKARVYNMNFDYGENYYSSMVAYLNSRAGSSYRHVMPPPRAEAWAERAHKSAKLRYPRQEQDLSRMLQKVRCNIRDYDMHHRQYTASIQNAYGGAK